MLQLLCRKSIMGNTVGRTKYPHNIWVGHSAMGVSNNYWPKCAIFLVFQIYLMATSVMLVVCLDYFTV